MGKTILTPGQSHFLELAAKEDEIIRWFYLTGGTALEDIDLFTTSEVFDPAIDLIVAKYIKQERALRFEKRKISGLFL